MKKRILVSTLLVFLVSSACGADQAGGTEDCADCHGADGLAAKSGIPHLNGQLLGYLEASIANFRNKSRPGVAFGHDPAGIDAARMTDILKRYSATKAVRPPSAAINPSLVARGETVYNNRCADCHPDNGRESERDSPLMAAQNVDYLIKQTALFVDGKRKFAFKMDDAFRGLSADDLTSVAHFFASQNQEPEPVKKKRRR